MKAIFIRSHGEPKVIGFGDLPEPLPGPGEVRVAVRAAGVNHLDLWVCRGRPGLHLIFPHALDSDMAGMVDAVGPGAIEPKAADAVVRTRPSPAVAARSASPAPYIRGKLWTCSLAHCPGDQPLESRPNLRVDCYSNR
jgi:NADPH:quinone reductase-like Zn-dependent oxidoreductase